MRTTRRAVLLAGVAATAAACTGAERDVEPAPPDPDVALRAAAVAREQALLAAYDAVLAAEPGRAGVLGPLRAEHEAHLAALGAPPPVPAASPAAAGTVASLVQAERAAAAAHAAATVPASPALAAVLAQLAASEASHPVALA